MKNNCENCENFPGNKDCNRCDLGDILIIRGCTYNIKEYLVLLSDKAVALPAYDEIRIAFKKCLSKILNIEMSSSINRANPCKFCNSKDLDFASNVLNTQDVEYVCCLNESCLADGPSAETKEEALDKWNNGGK